MNINIWDKKSSKYIEIHNVTFIANLYPDIKIETIDKTVYRYNAHDYTLDFIHASG